MFHIALLLMLCTSVLTFSMSPSNIQSILFRASDITQMDGGATMTGNASVFCVWDNHAKSCQAFATTMADERGMSCHLNGARGELIVDSRIDCRALDNGEIEDGSCRIAIRTRLISPRGMTMAMLSPYWRSPPTPEFYPCSWMPERLRGECAKTDVDASFVLYDYILSQYGVRHDDPHQLQESTVWRYVHRAACALGMGMSFNDLLDINMRHSLTS